MDRLLRLPGRQARLGFVSAICFALACGTLPGADVSMTNPIGKVARLFNPRLVKVESRVDYLNTKLLSLAHYEEHNLKTGIGCRGLRVIESDPDPTMTVDLGKEYPVESVFLVPLQGEFSQRRTLFPKRFTIEVSKSADFHDRMVLHTSGDRFFPETGGMPVKFTGRGATARFVRLTVNQGNRRGGSELFGLSELVVISEGYPVSFGCDVSATDSLDVEGLWYPGAITDGRMPLGDWQGGKWADGEGRGDFATVTTGEEDIAWTLDLGEEKRIDLVVLFPFDAREVLEAGILPEELEILARDRDGEFRTVGKWSNPMMGTDHETPLLFKLTGVRTDQVRVRGTRPRGVGAGSFTACRKSRSGPRWKMYRRGFLSGAILRVGHRLLKRSQTATAASGRSSLSGHGSPSFMIGGRWSAR